MQIESEVRLVLNLSLWISPRFSLFSFRTIVEKCSGVQVLRETLLMEREKQVQGLDTPKRLSFFLWWS